MRVVAIGVFLVLSGVFGCSSSDSAGAGDGGPGGGTVELGQPCITTSDCKVPAGQEVVCGCTPSSSTYVCAQKLEPGSPCGAGNFQTACRSDSYCVSHASGSDPVCEAYLKLGDDCSGTGTCGPGTTCDNGTCVTAHAIGGSCGGFEPRPCAAGATCDFGTSVCVAVKKEGEACSSSSECAPGADCFSSNGAPATCVTPKQEGQACTGYFDCADGLDCMTTNGSQVCVRQSQPTGCGIP